jgi:hypothetical protein
MSPTFPLGFEYKQENRSVKPAAYQHFPKTLVKIRGIFLARNHSLIVGAGEKNQVIIGLLISPQARLGRAPTNRPLRRLLAPGQGLSPGTIITKVRKQPSADIRIIVFYRIASFYRKSKGKP